MNRKLLEFNDLLHMTVVRKYVLKTGEMAWEMLETYETAWPVTQKKL